MSAFDGIDMNRFHNRRYFERQMDALEREEEEAWREIKAEEEAWAREKEGEEQ